MQTTNVDSALIAGILLNNFGKGKKCFISWNSVLINSIIFVLATSPNPKALHFSNVISSTEVKEEVKEVKVKGGKKTGNKKQN